MGKIGQYISQEEIACKCGCGLANMSADTIVLFDSIRDELGHPLIINSGCRCAAQNSVVGGKVDSEHLPDEDGMCEAIDIACGNSVDRLAIVKTAIELGCKRIGIANTFIHIDTSESKKPAIWLYKTNKR